MKIRPLRSYLTLLALGILVPILVFGVGMAVRFTEAQREAQERGMRETARALALAIDREVGQSLRALEVLGHDRSLREGDLRAFYNTCQDILRSQQSWRALALVPLSGKPLFTTAQPFGASLPDVSERPYFRAVLERGQPAVSGFHTSRTLGLPTALVAVPIFQEGRLVAVLTAAYDLRHFEQLWREQRVSEEWVGAMVDSSGIILSRSRGAEQYVGTSASTLFTDTVRQSPEGFFSSVTVDGMEVFTAYAHAQVAPWTIAFCSPRSAFNAARNRSLLGVLTMGLVCCLIALAWAAHGVRRITHPLRALASAATDSTTSPEAFGRVGASGIAELEDLRMALLRATVRVADREAALRGQMDAAQAARAEAEAANRAKDQFLAMLGHELRNPLAAITSGVKLLALSKDELRRERVRGLVERQALLLARLVDDLLDVARVRSGRILLQKRPLNLADSVRRALTALEFSGRTQAHQVVADVEPVWTEGDEDRIDQIITNLVSNALKYTPPGGRITVTTRERAGQAVLEVSDTGVGLSREALGRVFELFYQVRETLDRAQGGLGIGLTLVQRLAELHGGSIHAESPGPSRGSTFTLRLPGQVEVAPQRPVRVAAARPVRRVLVVEDHADTREAVRALLEAEGHIVFEAEDGATGLERARSLRPDAVLLDIGLPGQDGYMVAQALRSCEEGRGMLLVAVTGYGQQEDRLHALQVGFDEHLVKPMDIGRLRQLLARSGAASCVEPAA